ncbi:MarR family transcriptional regulator [Paucibacter sp. APW11]|uniref:MarR family transcriptional regulator n=1 Tax=Roseateles aquae TaxID=3077235 RepID=A0ABU3PC32_9BURK|nr:MarR family transcriptional regulator [Paucibacter sp. APW11]MDT9000124.1 MarR family transcriptional regulator [Paucibacter sp. APW11]
MGLDTPQRLDELLLYRLNIITRTSSLPLVRIFEGELGITRREWHLLALVAEQPGLSPSRLAELCWLDRPRVSRALHTLRQRGLIERQAAPRGWLALPSASGRQMYEKALARAAAYNRELVAGLSDVELSALDRALHKLQQQVQALAPDTAAASTPARRHAGGTRPR